MFILLDIDGVMIDASPWKRPEILEDNFMKFNSKSIAALSKILDATQAEIILTTTHKDSFNLTQWKSIFKKRNIPIISIKKLPKNTENLNRKDEILNWYFTNKIEDNFIIIDDDKSLNLLPEFLKEKLILTSATVGLTNYLADIAIENLKNQEQTLKMHEILI
jgi:Sec7-like guanine-nucleotide exchange factor